MLWKKKDTAYAGSNKMANTDKKTQTRLILVCIAIALAVHPDDLLWGTPTTSGCGGRWSSYSGCWNGRTATSKTCGTSSRPLWRCGWRWWSFFRRGSASRTLPIALWNTPKTHTLGVISTITTIAKHHLILLSSIVTLHALFAFHAWPSISLVKIKNCCW